MHPRRLAVPLLRNSLAIWRSGMRSGHDEAFSCLALVVLTMTLLMQAPVELSKTCEGANKPSLNSGIHRS
jgi:hypothetical protein